MKIAVFGGSFNPLHNGHAMLADTVVKELNYDKVLFIPTYKAPHKEYGNSISSEDRFNMVKAFCQSDSCFFEAEPCEIERGGISYTVDTLEYICEKYKSELTQKPGLIMGQEVAAEFHKWKSPEKIASMADFIIVPRKADYSKTDTHMDFNKPSGNYKGDFAVSFSEAEFKYPYTMLKEPMVTVSSTEIRNRIKDGKSFKYLVPSAVYEYIEEKGLYRK